MSSTNEDAASNDSERGEHAEAETDSVGSLLRQTLMTVDECFVYKIPPLATSGGHRAEHWDLAHPIQTCGFQVERRNNALYLLFTTDSHAKLYALSRQLGGADSNHVQSVTDSSRYFVTKIQYQQQYQWIGFGFRDRNVAIDLLGNLQQFQQSIAREVRAKSMAATSKSIPKLALGEKLHINMGSKTKSTIVKKQQNQGNHADNGISKPPLLLKKKPPKFSTTTISAATAQATMGKKSFVKLLSLGDIDLNADHKSVESSDSENAHGGASSSLGSDQDQQKDDDDNDDWNDFQSA